MASLASDSSPQLAGNLDANSKNVTNMGTISGTNLEMDLDFGLIA
jgi:hypothetical protein